MRLSKHGWLLWIALAVGLATAAALTQPPAAQAKTKEPCKLRGDKRYPGDFAPKTEIAQWMAEGAAKAKLPPELPVVAALVESELTNLNSGDADSVGHFQMRTSIWNHARTRASPRTPSCSSSGSSTRRSRCESGSWPKASRRPPSSTPRATANGSRTSNVRGRSTKGDTSCGWTKPGR
jgi:hypothetical protein